MVAQAHCRFCQTPLTTTFVDLGMSPYANSYLKPEQLNAMEPFYPLHVHVCGNCFLVQLEEFQAPDAIFSEYAYFSSFSQRWLDHAAQYCAMMTDRFALDDSSFVVELASNDGYLLKNFVTQGVPVLGIEPAKNVAEKAIELGVDSLSEFFGVELATRVKQQRRAADLIVANNVLAHVPDINDFVGGMKVLLADDGVATVEFPHLLNLYRLNQFDTIYHEHFSYLSLLAVKVIFEHHGLKVFDIEELATHGGSLRVYASHSAAHHEVKGTVNALLLKERRAGLDQLETYTVYSQQVESYKRKLLRLLCDLKDQGKTIVAYGAPAKGNTLLNYCGVGRDFVDYTVDKNPYKQMMYLPGTHIPIHHPDKIRETHPDYVMILPWNIKDEVMQQLGFIQEWGGQFIVPIPQPEVVS